MTVAEIFKDISAHMIKGLMVHSQLADYYRFLGLKKYAKCHEKHFEEESHNWRCLSRYYIEHFNALIETERIDDPEVIPGDWFNYKRADVDIMTKRRAVENGLHEWIEWEKDTKRLYEDMYSELMNNNMIAAALFISQFICDVDKELSEAQGYHLYKKAVDYDMEHIVSEQY